MIAGPPSPADYARMSSNARHAAAALIAELEHEAEVAVARRIAERERGIATTALAREDAERHRLAAIRRHRDTPTQQHARYATLAAAIGHQTPRGAAA